MRTAADRKAEAARHKQITEDKTKHLTPNKEAMDQLDRIVDNWLRNPIK
jgi:hypothetical protein